jgi:hypothetical protein
MSYTELMIKELGTTRAVRRQCNVKPCYTEPHVYISGF